MRKNTKSKIIKIIVYEIFLFLILILTLVIHKITNSILLEPIWFIIVLYFFLAILLGVGIWLEQIKFVKK